MLSSSVPHPSRARSLAADPGYLIVQAAKGVQRLAAEAVDDLDLRPPQMAVLIALDDLGPLSQRQLAECLDMDPSHVVGVIDELSTEELVRRERDPADRRCHRLVVTDAGVARLPHVREVVRAIGEALVDGLSEDDRDRLVGLLGQVVADLDRARLGVPVTAEADA